MKRLYGYMPMPYSEPGREAYIFAGYPSSVAYASANRILKYTVIGVALAAGVVASLAWFGKDLFVLQHIKALANTAGRLGEGDIRARTNVPHSREDVGQLAKTLDEVADSLERTLSERDKLEASLQEANAALKDTAKDLGRRNEDLEAFTYSVSHDLKEPLRAVQGFSQFLSANYSAQIDARGQELLGRIVSAASRMKDLIDDLLLLSRAGRKLDAAESVDTSRVVSDVIEALGAAIHECNAIVEAAALPVVEADRSRVEQVFANLITNGLKYNRSERPFVTITVASQDETHVTFAVNDNGIGIEEQYYDRIFGLFQRLHTRDEFDGNGAGLAIAKRAVEAMSGKIWLESAEGHGSTFFVTLPLAVRTEVQA